MSGRLVAPRRPSRVPGRMCLRCCSPGLPGPAVLVALVLTGCYSYHEVPLSSIPSGSEVRVQLTPEEAGRLASTGGVTFSFQSSGTLEGHVLEVDDVSMVLSAPLPAPGGSARQGLPTLEQRVRLQFHEVLRTELRELDRRRTYLAVGAAGLISAALLIHQLSGSVGGSTLDPGPGPAPESRSPLSIVFPVGRPHE